VEQGLICRDGSGRKRDPYRYWLPEKEDDFPPGPDASPAARERFERRQEAKELQSLGIEPETDESVHG
jgi:hypothetical protein